MARKPNDYWEKRSTELMKRLEKGTENTINSLIEVYEQATKNINKEIAKIYKSYAQDGVLSNEVLKQMLSKQETDIHYKNLLTVINNNITDKDLKKKMLAKYNAPAYSYRIKRYQALQENIDAELKKVANIEQDITKIRYINTINEAYYHNIYDIQKGTGLGFSFSQIDNKTINLMLNEKWIDNSNFSLNIWENNEKLGNYLKINLTADTLSGKSVNKIASEISDYMNVALYNATRLVRTEVNHFANEAEMLSYEELGIEKYKFIATLDQVTCEHCAELDNKEFNVKDRKPGKNYPPIHPNDRCTTVAAFDDKITEELTRRARDENGNPILVPQNMSYEQWKENYVDNIELKSTSKSDKINIIKTKEEKIIELQDILVDMNEARRKQWNLALTSKEDIIKLPQLKEMAFSIDLQDIDEKVIDAIIVDYKKLGNEYYTTLNHIGVFDNKDLITRPNSGGYAFTKARTLTGEIHFNQKILDDFEDYVETIRRCSEYGHIPKSINPENYKYYVSTHEFAHTIYNSNMLEKNLIGMDNKIYKDFEKELSTKFNEYKTKINNLDKEIKEINNKFVLDTENYTSKDSKTLKKLKQEREEVFVSNYAIRDNLEDEFMAECFAEAKLSEKPSKTSMEMLKIIDKYFKR